MWTDPSVESLWTPLGRSFLRAFQGGRWQPDLVWWSVVELYSSHSSSCQWGTIAPSHSSDQTSNKATNHYHRHHNSCKHPATHHYFNDCYVHICLYCLVFYNSIEIYFYFSSIIYYEVKNAQQQPLAGNTMLHNKHGISKSLSVFCNPSAHTV